MNPANKAVGSLVFKEGKTYFRLYKARNPISGELVYTDYLIDTSIGICVEIQDIEGGLCRVFCKNCFLIRKCSNTNLR